MALSGVATAALTLLGEGILVASVVGLWRRARHLDDPAPGRMLLAAVPLLVLGLVVRATRYAVGGAPGIDAYVNLLAGAAGWLLVFRGVLALPGGTRSARTAGVVLAVTAVASVAVTVGTPLVWIQLLLGVALGFLAAFLAVAAWRLRDAGVRGLVPAALLAGAYAAVLAAWLRALLFAAASAGDRSLFASSRSVQALILLVVAFLAWPGIEALGRVVRAPAPGD